MPAPMRSPCIYIACGGGSLFGGKKPKGQGSHRTERARQRETREVCLDLNMFWMMNTVHCSGSQVVSVVVPQYNSEGDGKRHDEFFNTTRLTCVLSS